MKQIDLNEFHSQSLFTCKDHLVTKEEFTLHQHSDLDILITNPRPNEMDLPSYYESENYISHTNSTKGLFDKLYQLVKSISLRSKTKLLSYYMNSSDSHLDIGAGTGSLIEAMKMKGYSSIGIEPSDQARSVANQNNLELHSSIASIDPKSSFKTISLFHVLEHLPNLNEDLQKITSLLHQDGRLVIAVPNFNSYDANHYKDHWAGFDVPRHLWHFSKTGISQLAELHNLQLEKVKPMWFDSFYVSLLSEQHKSGKRNWVKAIYIGLRSNLSAIRTKEYSSIIYILRKAK
ncbi:class I SAM-dependent methyltransferase [Spongiivirga citrea]|uniref:Methyltransferase domain-containing protein n=1 Tax=Spongiivirga citrea TaxID=1481457 RepID=A0A6M0CHH3_9FLAO|nr:class I SAM-dependent methyltransferase [Spongiivirga citrea]NER17398.1 methyltransferase domain-containing protein [Spongiivirga citrea]